MNPLPVSVRQTDFFMPGFDQTPIAVTEFAPPEPKALFLLVHGMQDHKASHFHFASFMAQRGFLTYGYDHRGEGATAGSPEKCGFIAPENGWTLLVNDMQTLIQTLHRRHPSLPFILFAHSMGAFAAQSLLMSAPQPIQACILSGSAYLPAAPLQPLLALLQHLLKKGDPKRPIAAIEKGVNFYFCRRIFPHKSRYDWVCANPTRINAFIRDPYCGWKGSLAFYRDLIFGLIYNSRHLSALPKDLPLFLVGGKDDALSNYGRSLKKLRKKYLQAGVRQVDLKLYPKGRHELMNESFQTVFFNDLIEWINRTVFTTAATPTTDSQS